MRKRISEQNIFPNFELYDEYRKIDMLLSEKKCIGKYNMWGKIIDDCYTLEEYIEQEGFNDWNLRGTFVSIGEMRQKLGIETNSISKDNINEDKVLDFLQYAINVVYRVSMTIKKSEYFVLSDNTIIPLLKNNIEQLVKKLNCVFDIDMTTKERFILYNNSTAVAVSKDYPDIKDSINEYVRIDNRRDLKRKEQILCTLFRNLESVERKLKKYNFGSILSDATFLFNKSGIRHWLDNDKTACETFLKMDQKELEEWYDKTFNIFLTCMVLAEYIDNIPSIKEIKRAIGD